MVTARRDTERIVPWVVSIGLHAGLLALGLLVTSSLVRLDDEEPPVLVTAEFNALTYEPVTTLEQAPPAPAAEAPRLPAEPLEAQLAEQLAALDAPAMSFELAAPAAVPDFGAAGVPQGAASFAGIVSTNARRIVYVIDASGSMIRSLPIVLDELDRSLSTLSPQQSFAVIFFQRNRFVMVPPAGRLQPATAAARRRALAWIDGNVIPAGRSNPLAALEKALELGPDVVFLLSENITGSGEFEIDQAELLRLLDELNPADETGRRAARINCVQFLDPDPLGTLERIAEQHGGPAGYRFLGRAELGVE